MRVSGTDSTLSTPSTAASNGSSLENPISALQTDYAGKCVSLFGFEDDSMLAGQVSEIGQVLNHYIYDWYGMRVAQFQSTSVSVDVVIVDENDLPSLIENQINATSIVVLCNNLSRRSSQRPSHLNKACAMEFVSKPFGPYKIAKAMYLSLERADNLNSIHLPHTHFSEDLSNSSNVDIEVPNLECLTLESQEGNKPIAVQTNGVITAGESLNAQMAVDNLPSYDTERPRSVVQGQEFPFPDQQKEDHQPQGRDNLNGSKNSRPRLTHRVTEPLAKPSPLFSNLVTRQGEPIPHFVRPSPSKQSTPTLSVPSVKKRPPRLLLVDDNSINLRLLETFMRKKKYKLVDSAENGAIAVKAAESHAEGYDIIFMGNPRSPLLRLIVSDPDL